MMRLTIEFWPVNTKHTMCSAGSALAVGHLRGRGRSAVTGAVNRHTFGTVTPHLGYEPTGIGVE